MSHHDIEPNHHNSERAVDPVTGEILASTSREKSRAKSDIMTTVGAILFTAFGLWGIYSHRVDIKAMPDPDRQGIAYNQDSWQPQPAPTITTGDESNSSVSSLKAKLAEVEVLARRTHQEAGHRVLSKRFERLNALLESETDEAELAYAERRLSELREDIGTFEQELREISAH